jgi:hypothetical protein
MKKLSLFALAAAGLFLGACSSDDAINEENVSKWNQGEKGYMALSINLPTTPTSRAANDVYDDGLADEYKVSDAGLLLFSGDDEASATVMYAQPLTLPFPEIDEDAEGSNTSTPPADNITTAYQAVAKVEGEATGANIYALVVLNYKNVLNIADGEATIAGTTTKVTTLASIQSAAANIVPGNAKFTNKGSNEKSDYFFMTNALLQVLGDTQSSTEPTKAATAPAATDIQTLVLIDQDKIYPTEEEAKANPAADIYVERAVAKATLTYDATGAGTIQATANGQTPLNVTKVEWAIDNYEPASFIVRNPGDNAYIAYSSEAFGATNHFRFVGDKAMGITAKLHNYYVPIYRHYWCIDPVYNKNATLEADGTGTERTAAEALLPATKYIDAGTTPLYCNENTFDVERQKYENTTRAVIKVTTDGGTFYTINGGEERFTEDNAKSYLVTDIVESSTFQSKIKSALKPGKSYTFSAASITPEYEIDEATAQVKVKSFTLATAITGSDDFYQAATDIPADAPAGTAAIAALDFADEIAAANGNWTVLKFTDGVVYYEARFEHFANTYYEKSATAASPATAAGAFAAGDLAPWNFWEPAGKKPTATVAYPAGTSKTAEENYLGRYGMVRNNWYDVTVSAFKKLGSPVDPTGKVDKPKTPDDSVEEYISIKIMVLSWAKRTQQWIL